jgi:hypothetical protein
MKPEDYDRYEQNVIEAVMQFNTYFSEYVKQMDEELWNRAVDYAKSFAKSGVVSFNYSRDKGIDDILSNLLAQQIFLKDLAIDIEDTREEYMEFVENHNNLTTQQIMEKWMKENDTTPDDPFGYEEDIALFVQCNHKFSFDQFDDDDWMNYTNICIVSVTDKNFQKTYSQILLDNHGEESDLYQYYLRCMEEQDNV